MQVKRLLLALALLLALTGPASAAYECFTVPDAASAALRNGEWTPRSSVAQSFQRLGVASAHADARLGEIVALQEPQPPRPKGSRAARVKSKVPQQ